MDRARAAADGLLPLDACATDTQSLVNVANYVWSATQIPSLVEATVLDVACGPGYGTDYLAQRARHAVGVDRLDVAVRAARDRYRRPNLAYLIADGESLPFADQSVHAVVSHEALMLVEHDDAFVAELARVLRPGGVAIVSVPWNAVHRESGAGRAYRRAYCWETFGALLGRHFPRVTFHRRRLSDRLQRLEGQLSQVRRADRFGLRRLVPRPLRHRLASIVARRRGLPALAELSAADVEYASGAGVSRSLIAVCRGAERGPRGVGPCTS